MYDARPKQIRIPSVDSVLRGEQGQVAVARFGHAATVEAVRTHIAAVREAVRSGADNDLDIDADAIATGAIARLIAADAPTLRRVFNLTGTVLHTNLGRAVLPEEAIEAAVSAMRHATNIELDIASGKRGERDDHVRGLVREITGAEDCVVVNNNASAVLLALNTFGNGKEAVVSRGELIEIGGAFRLPDIMARAGAKLIEVGTTNRTHLRDYENAMSPATGLIMKAHTSNYLIQGFTASVAASDLAALAQKHGVPFIDDLGSGTLVDLAHYGLRSEPTVQQALKAGADLVTFSGDKLLGGPQIGIVAGRKDLIANAAKNPLKRALRIDKIRMAALAATLKLYRNTETLPQRLPTLRMFVRSREDIRSQAERLLPVLASAFDGLATIALADCSSQIGSGALPLETLPSAGVSLSPPKGVTSGAYVETVARAFRSASIPVVGRIHDGALVLDLRCLDDEAAFVAELGDIARSLAQGGVP